MNHFALLIRSLNLYATWFITRHFAQNAVLSHAEITELNVLDNPGRIYNDYEYVKKKHFKSYTTAFAKMRARLLQLR
jgi:hypothetical protein